jgi:hypothetical protein
VNLQNAGCNDKNKVFISVLVAVAVVTVFCSCKYLFSVTVFMMKKCHIAVSSAAPFIDIIGPFLKSISLSLGSHFINRRIINWATGVQFR